MYKVQILYTLIYLLTYVQVCWLGCWQYYMNDGNIHLFNVLQLSLGYLFKIYYSQKLTNKAYCE